MDHTRDSRAHGGHRGRMRQRVQSRGFEGLEPHEIIEFLLFYAIPRQDVNELAHRLIDRFGSVQGVLRAELPALESVPGVGAKTARWLALVGEAAAASESLSAEDRPEIKNCLDAFRLAAQAERKLPSPCCVQLCLDVMGRLVYRRTICDSLSWGEPQTLREALGDMLSSHAHSAVLFVCAGERSLQPQEYDAEHAAHYAYTLRAADCQLLDVILMGAGELNSLHRCHMIPEGGESTLARAVREEYLLGMPEGLLRMRDFWGAD